MPDRSEAMDPVRHQEIRRRLVAESSALVRPATWSLIATALLLGGMSLWFTDWLSALAWVLLVTLAHLGVLFLSRVAMNKPDDTQMELFAYIALLGLTGAAWGSMPWIMGSNTSTGWLLIALALTIVMISAGTLAMRMRAPKAAFQGLLLVVGGIGLCVLGGQPAIAAALLMAVSFVVDQGMGAIARRGAIMRVGASLDIERLTSELRTVNAELSHAVRHDKLTDLPNRGQVSDAVMAASLQTGGSICLGYLDIDRFKLINDSHGHAAGDQLLIDAAQRLMSVMRADDFVSREGGDEFVLVFPNIETRSEAIAAGERVLEAFSEPFDIGGRRQRVSASLGLAVGRATEANELVRYADSALYEAKDRGRDRLCVFDEQLRERLDAKVRVEQDLRAAIKSGELTGWFQPIVDLDTGAYVGAECLARWVDDRFEETATFMPIAGELGLVVAATKAAVEPSRALLDIFASLRRAGSPTARVAINVPPSHAPEVINHIREQFGEQTFPHLTFELTETELIGEVAQVVGAIKSARDLGAHVVLDDFGTAYSALSLLVELPLDGVKIDQSFVAQIETDHVSQAIVAGVVQVSNFLGLSVIAEGVESEGQLKTLRQLGVRRAQGFYFSKAVPINEAVLQVSDRQWLRRDAVESEL